MRAIRKLDYDPIRVDEYGEIERAERQARTAGQRAFLLRVLASMDRYLSNAFMSGAHPTEDLFNLRDSALELARHLGVAPEWWDPMTLEEAIADRGKTKAKTKEVIPAELRAKIFERDDNTCQGCGATKHLTVDHKHPESKGGTLDEDNLWTLCKSCNSSKGVKSIDEWLGFDDTTKAEGRETV